MFKTCFLPNRFRLSVERVLNRFFVGRKTREKPRLFSVIYGLTSVISGRKKEVISCQMAIRFMQIKYSNYEYRYGEGLCSATIRAIKADSTM